MPCVLCGQSSLSTISTVDAKSHSALNVAICCRCGLVQQDPMPSKMELRLFYAHTYRTDYKNTSTPKAKHIYRAGMAAVERVNFLQSHGVHGGKLLDVGAGGGEFVHISTTRGYNSKGIEPNIGYSEFARNQYGVDIKTGELGETGETYDIITMFHVLEHMPDFETFKIAWSMLNEGGYLTLPRFHRHLHKWENSEIGGQHGSTHTTSVYRCVQVRGRSAHTGIGAAGGPGGARTRDYRHVALSLAGRAATG